MEERNGKTSEHNFYAEHKLGLTAVALDNVVHMYEHILYGRISGSSELKKAVQTSIKELCTALCNEID